jgi:hypothetical protein
MSNGLRMKYFVLKPEGDDEYAIASRMAMRAYAKEIEMFNLPLANDLRDWVEQEQHNALKKLKQKAR